MTTHKRKKVTKYRGSKTHGGGAMKKRRGAGHRGGRGMAGSGKRADTKKPSIWGNIRYFGKHGFTSHSTTGKVNAVNIVYIESHISTLLEKGIAVEKSGAIALDLTGARINKLLGTGKPSRKYEIIVESASARAIEKIESAGGKVVLPAKAEKKQQPEAGSPEKGAPVQE